MKLGQYLIVAALLLIHLAVLLSIFLSSNTGPVWPAWAWCGWVGTQLALLAIWTALATTRASLLRIPVALLLLTLHWLALVAVYRWLDHWFLTAVATWSALLALWIFLLTGIVLHGASRWTGWQLLLIPPENQHAARGQFRIRQLLILTAVIGVLLGIARLVLPTEGWDVPDIDGELAVGVLIFSIWILADTLLVIPICLWASSLNPVQSSLCFLGSWPLYSALIAMLKHVVVFLYVGERPADGQFTFFFAVNLAEGICLFASLLALRWAGWRLVRVTNAPETKS